MPLLGVLRWRDLPDLHKFNYPGADLVQLIRLTLKGEFAHEPGAFLYRRQIRPPESHAQRMKRYNSDEFQITRNILTKSLPLTRLPIELIKAVLHASIPKKEKLLLILVLIPALPFRYIVGRKHSETAKQF